MPNTNNLASLARESGGLAMLAIDQREALRLMLRQARKQPDISDQQMIDFKLRVTKELSPFASAILIDNQFALDTAVRTEAIDPECALIASADLFLPGNGIPVDRVELDSSSSAEHALELGAKAMKLLVLWREDESSSARKELVEQFVQQCHGHNLLAIIEPVVRPGRTTADFNKEEAILAAAEELGNSGADLYKGEMPYGGVGTDDFLFQACQELDARLKIPWVILSSGVAPDLFPNAVRQAVRAGAQGFLAGRAVWSATLPIPNLRQALRDLAVPRLKRLGEIVDEALASR